MNLVAKFVEAWDDLTKNGVLNFNIFTVINNLLAF
jgi:hypothetical protein